MWKWEDFAHILSLIDHTYTMVEHLAMKSGFDRKLCVNIGWCNNKYDWIMQSHMKEGNAKENKKKKSRKNKYNLSGLRLYLYEVSFRRHQG